MQAKTNVGGTLSKVGMIADINANASKYLGFPVTMAGISKLKKMELERMLIMYRLMAELGERANLIEQFHCAEEGPNAVLAWHLVKEEDRPDWIRDADLARWQALQIWHDWRGCQKAHWNPYRDSVAYILKLEEEGK